MVGRGRGRPRVIRTPSIVESDVSSTPTEQFPIQQFVQPKTPPVLDSPQSPTPEPPSLQSPPPLIPMDPPMSPEMPQDIEEAARLYIEDLENLRDEYRHVKRRLIDKFYGYVYQLAYEHQDRPHQ